MLLVQRHKPTTLAAHALPTSACARSAFSGTCLQVQLAPTLAETLNGLE